MGKKKEQKENKAYFNSLLMRVDFFYWKTQKMNRLKLSGQIVTLCRVVQYRKFILQKGASVNYEQILSTRFCSLFYSLIFSFLLFSILFCTPFCSLFYSFLFFFLLLSVSFLLFSSFTLFSFTLFLLFYSFFFSFLILSVLFSFSLSLFFN